MVILFDLELLKKGLLFNNFANVQSVTFLASKLSIWLVLVIFYGSHLEIQDGHLLHHQFFLN